MTSHWLRQAVTRILHCSILGDSSFSKTVQVVMIPDDNNSFDILGLYDGISSHTFDEVEPLEVISPSELRLGSLWTIKTYHYQ